MQPTTVDNTLIGIVLAIIAVIAVLAIAVMLVGSRNKRARRDAERTERERLGDTPVQQRRTPALADAPVKVATPASAPAVPSQPPAAPVVPPVQPPVAPPPPPLTDLPDVAPAPSEPAPKEATPDEPSPLRDEPIAAAAPLDASPAAEAQPEPVAPAPPAAAPLPPPAATPAHGEAPVTRIKGLGPKVAARLAELGITSVGQLAALDQRAAEDLDAHLGPFTGRMGRDRWLEQAQLLAAGDIKTFEERFGKL